MSFYTKHMYHFVNNALFVLCAWYCFERKSLASIRPGAAYFSGRAPRWLFTVLLAYVAIAYTHSGVTKVLYSGADWFDGSTLQLWISAYGTSGNLLAQAMLSSRPFATFSQVVTLLCEATILLGVFLPRLLPLYGLGLVGFHTAVELVFDFQFYGNIFVDFIVLLAYPIYLQRSTSSSSHTDR